jgi:polyphosphate glucokinase
MSYLGVEISSASIKFGSVSLECQHSIHDFDMVLLPKTSNSAKYANILLGLLRNTETHSGIGIGFPGSLDTDNSRVNFEEVWEIISAHLTAHDVPHFAIKDADAAGFAEVYSHGNEDLRQGLTLVLTFGPGIGSSLFHNGRLLPDTDFGSLEINGVSADYYASPSAKRRDGLGLRDWASRLQEYIVRLESIFSLDHILLGGPLSAEFDDFSSCLTTRRAILSPAIFRNQACVVGSALFAAHCTGALTFLYNKTREQLP